MKFLSIPAVLWVIAIFIFIAVPLILYSIFFSGKLPWLDEKIRLLSAQKTRFSSLFGNLKTTTKSWRQQQKSEIETVENHPKVKPDKWSELLARLNADPDNLQPYLDIAIPFFAEKGLKPPAGSAKDRKNGVPHGLSVNDGEKVCEFIKKEGVWEKVIA